MSLKVQRLHLAANLHPCCGTELEPRQVPAQWDVEGTCWRVAIVPMEDGEPVASDDPSTCCVATHPLTQPTTERMELVFAHTPQYPEVPPLYKVRNLRGVSDADLEACMAVLAAVVEENLGMAMIFNLVTAAQDWLREVVCSACARWFALHAPHRCCLVWSQS